jgi:hypothetical protein
MSQQLPKKKHGAPKDFGRAPLDSKKGLSEVRNGFRGGKDGRGRVDEASDSLSARESRYNRSYERSDTSGMKKAGESYNKLADNYDVGHAKDELSRARRHGVAFTDTNYAKKIIKSGGKVNMGGETTRKPIRKDINGVKPPKSNLNEY